MRFARTALLFAGLLAAVFAAPPGASFGDSDPEESVQPMTTTAPRPTNRLSRATSPYLLQHAHNPVDWYEWGPEALDRARAEDRPIFLSIGYSACHWCHVMERESFENEEIARILNDHFVSIKVDREERPDLDDIYMKATVLYNQGQGGWPMSVFLTPDLRPFFAGTYFPPDARYGRPGFRQLLLEIAGLWKSERPRIDAGAVSLSDAVRRYASVAPGRQPLRPETLATAVAVLQRAFDPIKGGISSGGTNKFPPSMALDLMLRVYHRSLTDGSDGRPAPRRELLQLVETTLDRMARGGIYDQLGGGIHRYSTDADWLVPHFEKMLYDQALVCGIYLDAWRLTRKPLYARVAREICDYVIDDLQSHEGGYFSTRDADSEGVEGKYYVWSRDEIVAALGEADAELFCGCYDVSVAGNWEGRNILNVPRDPRAVAKLHRVEPAELERRLEAARDRLRAVRDRRVPPHLDDKVLAGWNGLMIASMARAGRILDEPRFLDSARRAADFVLTRMRRDGRLLRTFRDGQARIPAFLEDYAFMIEGLLHLYEATLEPRWLDEAVRLNDVLLKHFRDEKDGGFFFTADNAEAVLVRAKDAHDGATPSGNSVQLMNLLRLAVLLDRSDLADEADRLQRCFQAEVEASPLSSERLLAAVDFATRRPREVVFVAREPGPPLDDLLRAFWQAYVPNYIVAGIVGDPKTAGRALPLLEGRTARDGRPTAYVCENYVCKAPTTDPAELLRQLGVAAAQPARGDSP